MAPSLTPEVMAPDFVGVVVPAAQVEAPAAAQVVPLQAEASVDLAVLVGCLVHLLVVNPPQRPTKSRGTKCPSSMTTIL